MKVINELATSLNQQFKWNKSRMNCFVRMLIGLISVRNVNLQERVSKLMALLAVGFAWRHKIGEWTALKKPILFKKFHTEQRPQNSFFRLGLDVLPDCFFHANFKKTELKQATKLILLLSFYHGEPIL